MPKTATWLSIEPCRFMRTIPESQDRAIGAARDLDRTGSDCYLIEVWVINSVVECVLHTDEVTGSNPVSPTSVYLQASPETSSGLASLFPTLFPASKIQLFIMLNPQVM